MRPISYEVRRTLTSKFVVLMMIAIIGLSSLLAYESASTFNSPSISSRTPYLNVGYYQSQGNITIVTYAFNPYGDSYSGLQVYVDSQNGTAYSLVSNSQGYANVTFQFNSTSASTIGYNYTYNLFGTTIPTPKGSIAPVTEYSGFTIAPRMLVDRNNNSNLGIQMLYVGPNGSSSPDTTFSFATYQAGQSAQQIVSNATYTANVSGVNNINLFPTVPSDIYNKTFALAVTTNGTSYTFHPQYPFPPGRLSSYTPMTQNSLQALVFSGISFILGLLIPILGVFAAYLTYGKDRTTGVLESVLKRPVTRQGIISSRFLANSVSIVISVIVSMIIADLIIHHYFSMWLTTYFTVFLMWTYIVEGLSFLALIYMFSHVVKSQGALLGVSIAVFVVMALFWSIIPATILAVLSVPTASSLYIFASVAFNYASPSGYSTLVQFHFTNHIGLLSAVSANPSSYAVTPILLIISGIIWIVAPFAVAYYLARKYD